MIKEKEKTWLCARWEIFVFVTMVSETEDGARQEYTFYYTSTLKSGGIKI